MEAAETDASSGKSWRYFKMLARNTKYSRRKVWQKLLSTITVRSESRANSPFVIRLGTLLICQAGRPLVFAAVGIRKTSPSATAPTAKSGFNQKYKHGLCRPRLPSPRNKGGLNAKQPSAAEQQANGYCGGRFCACPHPCIPWPILRGFQQSASSFTMGNVELFSAEVGGGKHVPWKVMFRGRQ
jgi:hypothetical protein